NCVSLVPVKGDVDTSIRSNEIANSGSLCETLEHGMRFANFIGLLALAAIGCRPGVNSEAKAAGSTDVRTVNSATAAVIEKPISRFVAATGTLTAEEQADVSAEVAGRVVATPVERGTLVSEGAELIRISDTEVRAQVQEAEANALRAFADQRATFDRSRNHTTG